MLKKETQFIIYTSPNCPKCEAQKEEWFNFGIEYEERDSSRIKNHQDEYDKEAHVEAAFQNERLPIIIERSKPVIIEYKSENSDVKK